MNGWLWNDFLCEEAQATMDRDRKLFEEVKAEKSPQILRFYGWKEPTLSYGRTQGMDLSDQKNFMRCGWRVVKRPTGGGKVFHKEDLCFCIIWKKKQTAMPWGIVDSYCAIHNWIQKSLQRFGMETGMTEHETLRSAQNEKKARGWCFESPVLHDLFFNGKKIVGGAQWRDGDTALHQGSIQVRIKEEALKTFRQTFSEMFSVKLLW